MSTGRSMAGCLSRAGGLARTTAWVVLCVAAAACSDKDKIDDADKMSLTGTIGERYPLEFTQMRAYRLGHNIVVVYETPGFSLEGTNDRPLQNQVARITFNTDLQEPETKVEIPFWVDGGSVPPLGVARYVISKGAYGLVQGAPFPPIAEGSIQFMELGDKAGETIKGRFEITFDTSEYLTGAFWTELSAP